MEKEQKNFSDNCSAVENLNQRIKAIEDCLRIGVGLRVNLETYSNLRIKCGSSLGKAELIHLFFVLMDEEIWLFDAADKKINRSRFQNFIFQNFTYSGDGGRQTRITGVSRHFSECKGYSYREKQLMYLNRIIKLLTNRKERIENQ